MEVMEKPKVGISTLTFDQLAQLRNKLSAEIKAQEEVVSALKVKREKVDVEFLRRFNEQGLTNVKTAHGTPYIIERTSVSVADADAFRGWVTENKALDFMELRANKSMVEAYKETHGDLPPGLNWYAKLTIGLKKS